MTSKRQTHVLYLVTFGYIGAWVAAAVIEASRYGLRSEHALVVVFAATIGVLYPILPPRWPWRETASALSVPPVFAGGQAIRELPGIAHHELGPNALRVVELLNSVPSVSRAEWLELARRRGGAGLSPVQRYARFRRLMSAFEEMTSASHLDGRESAVNRALEALQERLNVSPGLASLRAADRADRQAAAVSMTAVRAATAALVCADPLVQPSLALLCDDVVRITRTAPP